TRQPFGALLYIPLLLHGAHIERGELAEIAVGAGHLEEPPVGLRAAAAVLLFDDAAIHFHAGLHKRNDERARGRVVAHGLPVLAARGAGAGGDPVTGPLLKNVRAVGNDPLGPVLPDEDVLEHRLLGVDELAVLAIELPQYAGLTDVERHLPSVDIDEHALIDLVQIE